MPTSRGHHATVPPARCAVDGPRQPAAARCRTAGRAAQVGCRVFRRGVFRRRLVGAARYRDGDAEPAEGSRAGGRHGAMEWTILDGPAGQSSVDPRRRGRSDRDPRAAAVEWPLPGESARPASSAPIARPASAIGVSVAGSPLWRRVIEHLGPPGTGPRRAAERAGYPPAGNRTDGAMVCLARPDAGPDVPLANAGADAGRTAAFVDRFRRGRPHVVQGIRPTGAGRLGAGRHAAGVERGPAGRRYHGLAAPTAMVTARPCSIWSPAARANVP